jgi:hypothetical protein
VSRRFLLLLAALVGVVLMPVPANTASASCAGPSLGGIGGDVRIVLERGATTSVEGRGFVDGCRDTMSCSGVGGCSRCSYDDPPEGPLQDIALEVRQHGRSWALGTADAGTAEEQVLGQVTWRFEVPRGLHPGRARLVADGSQPVVVEVR